MLGLRIQSDVSLWCHGELYIDPHGHGRLTVLAAAHQLVTMEQYTRWPGGPARSMLFLLTREM